MRFALAVLLLLHGIAHLVGFASSFHLSPKIPAQPDILGGVATLAGRGLKAYGIAWLLAGHCSAAVALGAALGASWWVPAAWGVSSASLGLCILGWPASTMHRSRLVLRCLRDDGATLAVVPRA